MLISETLVMNNSMARGPSSVVMPSCHHKVCSGATGSTSPITALSMAAVRAAWAAWGAWAAVIGMVALTFCELLAIRYADWPTDLANAGLMGTCYGISVTMIGLGMLAAGVGVLRAGVWHGWRRWTPLAIGIATFAVVTPGMFGGFVIARVAIGSWLLLLAALG
jgi:hypothetical protein